MSGRQVTIAVDLTINEDVAYDAEAPYDSDVLSEIARMVRLALINAEALGAFPGITQVDAATWIGFQETP